VGAIVLSREQGDLQGAAALVDRALAINPNSANAWLVSGALRTHLGEPDLAIEHLERCERLSPRDVNEWLRCLQVSHAHFAAGRHGEALSWVDKALHDAPHHHAAVLSMKAAICGVLDRIVEGRKCVDQMLAINPDVTAARFQHAYRVYMQPQCLAQHLEGLRKAGLPE
jgi:adenylate cyclase